MVVAPTAINTSTFLDTVLVIYKKRSYKAPLIFFICPFLLGEIGYLVPFLPCLP